MWLVMTGILGGSAVVIGRDLHHGRCLGFGHIMLMDAARALLMFCIYWFSARLWFWFDKS